MNQHISNRNLYLDAKRERVVEEADPDAAFLLAAEGGAISLEDAERYGVKVTPAPSAIERETARREAALNRGAFEEVRVHDGVVGLLQAAEKVSGARDVHPARQMTDAGDDARRATGRRDVVEVGGVANDPGQDGDNEAADAKAANAGETKARKASPENKGR